MTNLLLNKGSIRSILALSLLLVVGCNQTKHGCIDIEACNYDPDANTDDASCEYTEEDSDCDDVFTQPNPK